jgi:hypothetical protein
MIVIVTDAPYKFYDLINRLLAKTSPPPQAAWTKESPSV